MLVEDWNVVEINESHTKSVSILDWPSTRISFSHFKRLLLATRACACFAGSQGPVGDTYMLEAGNSHPDWNLKEPVSSPSPSLTPSLSASPTPGLKPPGLRSEWQADTPSPRRASPFPPSPPRPSSGKRSAIKQGFASDVVDTLNLHSGSQGA